MIDPAVRLPHRLSVVWFSDLVGWSSLTAEDEDKAIALVRRFQATVTFDHFNVQVTLVAGD